MWLHDKPKHYHKKPQLLDYWMKDPGVDKIRVNTSNIFLKKKYTKINNSILSKSKKNNYLYYMNNNNKVIVYTGVGANNGGKHSKKRFMKIAKKEFAKACSKKLSEKKCNPCKKLKEFEFEIMDAEFEAMEEGKKYKISKNKSKRRSNLKKKCKKCTKKKGKKCNFEELLEYSGAELMN